MSEYKSLKKAIVDAMQAWFEDGLMHNPAIVRDGRGEYYYGSGLNNDEVVLNLGFDEPFGSCQPEGEDDIPFCAGMLASEVLNAENPSRLNLGDLADLVSIREHDLAPGSETCLLGPFCAEYDIVSKILDGTSRGCDQWQTVTHEEYYAWRRAYDLMERFERDGIEYDTDMLF